VLSIVARGERRFRIAARRLQADGLARASVEILPQESDAEVPADCRPCAQLLSRLLEQHADAFEPPHRLDSSAWVSARLAEILPLELAQKQQLLEMADGRARLERLSGLLGARGPA
jgi:Lon protease-like protein